MLLVYALIAAILIAYLRGGRLRNYGKHPLRAIYLPCLAFMIEACFGFLYEFVSLSPDRWLGWAVCLEYALLAAFLGLNWRRRGMKLLSLATLSNFAAIAANGFRMPVTPIVQDVPGLARLVARIQSGELMEYALVDWDAPLWFLGDTIPLFGGLASLGDLLMAAGMLALIVHLLRED